MFSMKYFIVFAAVDLITETRSYFHFNSNPCYGEKFVQQNYAAYQFNYHLKKWSQTDKY